MITSSMANGTTTLKADSRKELYRHLIKQLREFDSNKIRFNGNEGKWQYTLPIKK